MVINRLLLLKLKSNNPATSALSIIAVMILEELWKQVMVLKIVMTQSQTKSHDCFQ